MTPARYIFLLILATLFAALGVAQRTQTLHSGYQLESLQAEHAVLADQNRQLLCDISALSRPARIAGEIERSEIALMDPITLTQSSGTEKRSRQSDGTFTGPR